MISLRTVKAAIVQTIHKEYPDARIYFDNVEKARMPYFYVDVRMYSKTWGEPYVERKVNVSVQYIPHLDADKRAERVSLYDVHDALVRLFSRPFLVEDRAITILDMAATIFDEILTFSFTLDFCDAFTRQELGLAEPPVMQNLGVRINTNEQVETDSKGDVKNGE